MRNRIGLLACMLISFLFVGCKSKYSTEQGFTIRTDDVFVDPAGNKSPAAPRPFVPVSGDLVAYVPGYVEVGSRTYYNESTDSTGTVFIGSARVPALWTHYVTFPIPCGTAHLVTSVPGFFVYDDENVFMMDLSKLTWECQHFLTPSASTRLAVQDSTPSTLTLGAGDEAPFSTAYGMPVLYLYNPDTSMAASVTASSVASDGSSATFPFPTLPSGSQLPANLYGETLLTPNASGGYDHSGFNFLSMASHQTLDSPFGVAAGWSNSSYNYSYTPDPYGDGTCVGTTTVFASGSSSSQFPIVSLYSDNKVLVGSTTIPVGIGPTTVLAYAEQTTDNYQDTLCQYNTGDYVYDTTTDQLTRAIVANSGSDSVTILDIVNDVAVGSVPVGHIPTGISLSPDQSKAYVTNYGDGTVSELDLNAMTVIATVTIGGNPISVSTANDGSVWVGGNGYISKLTASLGVVGTYSTNGKTVLSLSVGNSVSELAVTSADSNGNVYIDEVNTTATVQSNSCVLNASHQVSTLGTYVNSQNQTVRAYSRASMSSPSATNSSSALQTSNPTLIVNDGWVSVSATPTGLAVTDIATHAALMQIATPAPVTGIAVDSNIHVAYVAIPDANELLTVPLPN